MSPRHAVFAAATVLVWVDRGRRAPAVTFTTLAGKPIAPGELRGKVVLVNFCATTCAVCARELPEMAAMYRTCAPRGFEITAVAMPYDRPDCGRLCAARAGAVHGGAGRRWHDQPRFWRHRRHGDRLSRRQAGNDPATAHGRAGFCGAARKDRTGVQPGGWQLAAHPQVIGVTYCPYPALVRALFVSGVCSLLCGSAYLVSSII
jgi:hypothetical protein